MNCPTTNREPRTTLRAIHVARRLFAVLALFFVVASHAFSAPPNILILCADDHAAYVTGCYDNKLVRTPNIDRLAAGGIRFLQAYCNSPVCTASRQSLLTGRYPRTIGVTQLQTPLPESEVTLAETYRLAGFDTASIGKMHFNSDLKHGFDLRVDHPDYRKWLKAQPAASVPEGVAVLGPWRPFKDPARVWLNAECRPVDLPSAQMDGTFFSNQAAEYLAAKREKPFFLMVSWYQPHSPYQFPLEFRDRHRAAEMPKFVPGPEDDEQIPAGFRDLTESREARHCRGLLHFGRVHGPVRRHRARRARPLGPGGQHDRGLPGRPWIHAGPAWPVREALQLRPGNSRSAGDSLSGQDRRRPAVACAGRAGRPGADPA